MHPFINRQSKVSLRWHDDPSHLTRNTWHCKDDGDLCAFAQDHPSYMILPFQFMTTLKPTVVNEPTAWGLYTPGGALVVDLSAYIPNLQTVQVLSPGPVRTVIVLDVPIMLDTPLPEGRFEMRIETVGATYYSELLNIVCGPCEVVDGVYGIDDPQVGLRYAYTNGRVATYCGPECQEPNDENGFSAFAACSTGQVMTHDAVHYAWDGSTWVRFVEMPCHYVLKWRNCGDVGTVLYSNRGFENTLFLSEGEHSVQDPTPIIAEQRQADSKGREVLFQARKDVDWTFRLGRIPWYLVDALTEIPLLNDVRLRMPRGVGYDKITDIRFTVTWSDPCEADVTMVFRADESASSTRCCDEYDIEEEPPTCPEADAEITQVFIGGDPYLRVNYASTTPVVVGVIQWLVNDVLQPEVNVNGVTGTYDLGPLNVGDQVYIAFTNENDRDCDDERGLFTVQSPCELSDYVLTDVILDLDAVPAIGGTTTSGYFGVFQNGTLFIVDNATVAHYYDAIGEACVYPCDADGTPSGVWTAFAVISSFDGSHPPAREPMDLSPLDGLTLTGDDIVGYSLYVDIASSNWTTLVLPALVGSNGGLRIDILNLTDIVVPEGTMFKHISAYPGLSGLPVTQQTVDDLCNALDPSAVGETSYIFHNFGPAPSADSADARSAYEANNTLDVFEP